MSMERFRRKDGSVERSLRRERPEPSSELIRRITGDLESRPARRGWSLALAVALTCALVAAFSLSGGISYAASAVGHGTTAVTHLVTGKSVGAFSSNTQASHPNGHPKNGPEGKNHDQGDDNQGDDEGSDDDQYGHKVLMCHHPNGKHPHTISVDQHAVPAHLAHGDTLGPCPGGNNHDKGHGQDHDDD